MDLNVEDVAKLARIKLTPHEEEKFSKDLRKILDHFKELQELNTDKVKPLTGGTDLKNAFREDKRRLTGGNVAALVEAFPDRENGFLKIPPVFE